MKCLSTLWTVCVWRGSSSAATSLKATAERSEAAERKNLKTEKLIFDNFFGQMSEANEYQVVLRESFEKVSRTNGLRGVKIKFYHLRSDKIFLGYKFLNIF